MVYIVGVKTIAAMRDGVRQQNLLTLARDIQSDDQRKARGVVYALGERQAEAGPNLNEWSREERTAVEHTCQLFELALLMENKKMVPASMISGQWAYAIERCWVVASPLIENRETEEGSTIWVNFKRVGRAETERDRTYRPDWLINLTQRALESSA